MKNLFISLTACLSALCACGQTNQSFKSVDVAEFEKVVANEDYIVLDVRTAEEYAEGHIPGTDFNIDVLNGNFTREALAALPKERPVALYCRSGNRSKRAAKILADNGYQVLELATGFRGWASEGKDVVR